MFSSHVWRAKTRTREDFAFVRWYERRGRRDVLNCTRLVWRAVGTAPHRRPVCGVIPLATILRSVDLQRDHAIEGVAPPVASGSVAGAFYVNRFRWS